MSTPVSRCGPSAAESPYVFGPQARALHSLSSPLALPPRALQRDDARSIREFTKQLEACGILDVIRLKLPDGTARLHYEPGRPLLAAVEQFDALRCPVQ